MNPVRMHEVGDVAVWVDGQMNLHVKAIVGQRDPVELSPDEARILAAILLGLAEVADE
jgi:hypothetical protein